ncbi:unnamed protein product [Notodromas monacha]|uniref:Methyltransferase type 11 domain-containing protein n=1 Tax=Notodromas monacha TaxID=399045 RepID=A0A7R9BXW2_9CRUS|nr:unnamed protein product [Notodromas monacha]CAG0922840.1 unnamed protein product [Notodromas monacha]
MARLLDNYIYGFSHFRMLLNRRGPFVQRAASAVDVSYFPPNTLLTVVDPNPDFEQGIKDEIERNPGIELQCYVIVPGEDMRPIADDSMDAVVTTMALSRAENTHNMLAEIHRVLAPGGKYYFWEPVEFEHDEPLSPVSPHFKAPTSPKPMLSPKSPGADTTGTSPKNPFIFQRQTSTEVVTHARTEVREPQDDHGTLSNLKVLVNVALRRPRRNSSTVGEHRSDESIVEQKIRSMGFSHVSCENFLLDDPSDEDLNKKTWMERRMSLSVPKHWHLKGIAEKGAAGSAAAPAAVRHDEQPVSADVAAAEPEA